jgi:hypothetical protein
MALGKRQTKMILKNPKTQRALEEIVAQPKKTFEKEKKNMTC